MKLETNHWVCLHINMQNALILPSTHKEKKGYGAYTPFSYATCGDGSRITPYFYRYKHQKDRYSCFDLQGKLQAVVDFHQDNPMSRKIQYWWCKEMV